MKHKWARWIIFRWIIFSPSTPPAARSEGAPVQLTFTHPAITTRHWPTHKRLEHAQVATIQLSNSYSQHASINMRQPSKGSLVLSSWQAHVCRTCERFCVDMQRIVWSAGALLMPQQHERRRKSRHTHYHRLPGVVPMWEQLWINRSAAQSL